MTEKKTFGAAVHPSCPHKNSGSSMRTPAKRRLGCVRVQMHNLGLTHDENMRALRALGSKMAIIRVEPGSFRTNMEPVYYGECSQFEEVEPGQKVPWYQVQVQKGPDGSIEGVVFERIGHVCPLCRELNHDG